MAKIRGTLVYTGKHDDRLNVVRTVAQTVKKITGNQGNVCLDHVYEELLVQDAPLTKHQVKQALNAMANLKSSKYIRVGLINTGNGWYEWEKK